MPKPLPSVIREDEIGHVAYERVRSESLRKHRDYEPSEFGRPQDRFWVLRRSWTGETYYVEGVENEYVRHAYNPLDALKD
jgi:hypothetical protein